MKHRKTTIVKIELIKKKQKEVSYHKLQVMLYNTEHGRNITTAISKLLE